MASQNRYEMIKLNKLIVLIKKVFKKRYEHLYEM